MGIFDTIDVFIKGSGFLKGLSSVFSIAAGVSNIISGLEGKKAGDTESRALKDQAESQKLQAKLLKQEANAKAASTAKQRSSERARLKLRFLKGGITIDKDSSAALFLNVQKTEDEKEVASIRARGGAQLLLGYSQAKTTGAKASIAKNRGREALFGSFLNSANSFSTLFS